MIKVAGYCRVSTDRDDQANSFEAQQRYFREYIAGQPDWELHEIYADEGITGTSTKKRIQFNRMMNDAYDGRFRMIITKEVSRFSRNVLDTIRYTRDLKAIGIGVLFMTDRINTLDPEAEMLLSFLASLAQEESRKTSTRVVWGQTRQMERGVVFGRSLLGYEVRNGKLYIDPDGAALVRLIFHKYAVEQMGTSEIARYLTGAGCRTCGGSSGWKSNTVIKILKNEKYVGDLVQKKTYTPDFLTHRKRRNTGQVPVITIENHHEPIISREVWDLTQAMLRRNNKHRKGEGGHSNRYVCSGRIRCDQCGGNFTPRYRKQTDGTRLRRWCCPSAGCGIGKTLRDDDAMRMLKTAIMSLPMDAAALIGEVSELAADVIRDGQNDRRDDPRRTGLELERVRRKREAVLDSFFAGDISKADMQAMLRRYDQQMEELHCRLERSGEPGDRAGDKELLPTTLRAQVEAILTGTTESDVFYKTILDQITVFRDRHLELRLNGLPHVFRFTG